MKRIAITLIVSALVASSQALADWELSGTNYEGQSAAQKQQQLWNQITQNPKSNDWFSPAALAGIFVESMEPSLKWVGDTFENGFFGARSKYIHTVGNTATAKFTPVSNNQGYTGIFQSGADHAVIRLSLAKQPDSTKPTPAQAEDNFIPGFGLKFLRDNTHSGNLVAMYGVDGANTWNFFRQDFSNHIPDPISVPQQILGKKFATATPYIQYVGLSDIASYDQHGKQVSSPKFPFQLVFESPLKEKYSEEYTQNFQDQLQQIPQGTLLYKVFAYADPSAQKVHIADLTLTSPLVKSFFGDRYLFFKHQDMQEDLLLRPEWKSHLKVASPRCPVTFIKEIAQSSIQTISKLFSQ
ncbi:UNKNOWN [Stylonychia lemnae]|uniref:Uncharacterized protein n=1 Tax=Stylonychia lemnae TaxID=5949 RepID=A0A078AVM4_STYLE|nr:UNKNOWN [Stylonychia lemnae]|eukprot:CDW86121.1 UNKNOWN [Stylonychia lemnae]